MLHPSYTDLMKVVNSDSEANNTQPIVNSRYSIVLATAKRARQIIDGAPTYATAKCNKPLSIAVEELATGKVKILSEEEVAAQNANEYSGADSTELEAE
ncbi:MAG: DNA-directed RNA polymerase subunit omega [Lachnospiraceae bacterium]|nr:DNA-directed RNA polymerase subunit omega [Lachnospiraceae bacterium]MCR4993263.1 DNA-directed RNA polymerase subunit omega [Lachnospiraceae bacterium]